MTTEMCGNDVMLLTNNILKTKGSLRATFVENMSRNLTLIVDEWCSQVLLEAEDLSEVSAERERAGNLTEALVNCQRAIGRSFNAICSNRMLLTETVSDEHVI